MRNNERAVLEAMLDGKMRVDFNALRVVDAKDGGMGGIRFLATGGSKALHGGDIARAEYVDTDDILVSIVVDVDKDGNLYEMDFWKVNFTPLRLYPEPNQLKIKS